MLKLHAFTHVTAFVLLCWLPFVKVHHDIHGKKNGGGGSLGSAGIINLSHACLTLFNAINVLVCLWEMSLFVAATSVLVRESERARGAELEALARDLVHVCFVGPELRANAKLGILGRHRERVRDDCAHDVDDGRGDVRFE